RSEDASALATGFEQSLAVGDPAAACSALAPETLGELESTAKRRCAAALPAEQLPVGGPVREVDVYGRQARVVLRGDTLFLSQFADGWKVVAAGCLPQRASGKPYECAVKGA
ncbi:MAG TPA: hypothetical protein VFH94_17195, partial [Streptomyces sp.]|nr:hypothetical protein [Streptomyces sp.]